MNGKTIVVSGVNIRKGGTLTIMRDCLRFLSENLSEDNRIVAFVHDKSLTPFPGIEFIECPDSIKSWGRRLWTEYVKLRKLSEHLGDIDLWLSLHDTTPFVKAKVQAVYCQTSFPFLKWHLRDGLFDKKIPLFALFTRFAYRINVHRNRWLVVQQFWLRDKLSEMLGVERDKFLVFPPQRYFPDIPRGAQSEVPTFGFVSTPDCHKNFETLCKASSILEKRLGKGKFKVVITTNGGENKYSRWLYKKWGNVDSLEFRGLLKLNELIGLYSKIDCFVFPSRIETWGLPISEFMQTSKPLILADLPYSRETSAGASNVAYFPVENPDDLSTLMEKFVKGDLSDFKANPRESVDERNYIEDWGKLFNALCNDKDM